MTKAAVQALDNMADVLGDLMEKVSQTSIAIMEKGSDTVMCVDGRGTCFDEEKHSKC